MQAANFTETNYPKWNWFRDGSKLIFTLFNNVKAEFYLVTTSITENLCTSDWCECCCICSKASVTKLGWALSNEHMSTLGRQSDVLYSVTKPIMHIKKVSNCFQLHILSSSGYRAYFGHRKQIFLVKGNDNIYRPETVTCLKGGWSSLGFWPIIIRSVVGRSSDNGRMTFHRSVSVSCVIPNPETERYWVDHQSACYGELANTHHEGHATHQCI